MRHLLTVLLYLVPVIWLVAQEAAPSSPQRWYFSSHAGIATSTYSPRSSNHVGSGLLLNEIGYRLTRNIEVGTQIGLQRESGNSYGDSQTTLSGFLPFTASWNSRKSNTFIGLLARFNYRVGQGDLSLSGSYGLNRHSNLVRAKGPQPFSARIRMSPLTYSYYTVNLGYTYWATPRFGLMIGFSIFTPVNKGLTRNVEILDGNSVRYVIADLEVEGREATVDQLSGFRSLIDSSSRQYFTLGLTTRIF